MLILLNTICKTLGAPECTTMFISYPNDSYFWVLTNFSGMDVKTSLKTWTPSTALILIEVNHFFF